MAAAALRSSCCTAIPKTHLMWHKVAPRLARDFMALDYPERVRKLAILDIVPTGEAFRRADMAFGLGFWHWFFLAQPYDLPERLIGADPDAFYLRQRDLFAPEALKDYLRCVRDGL